MTYPREALHRARTLCKSIPIPPTTFVFLLVVLLELEESVQRAPTIRLLEHAICQKHYQDELHGADDSIDESMCKLDPIQVRLAYVRGMLSFFDSLPSELLYSSSDINLAVTRPGPCCSLVLTTVYWIVILFGSIFGTNADKNGRRSAFALAVSGTLCAMVWIYFTCEVSRGS